MTMMIMKKVLISSHKVNQIWTIVNTVIKLKMMLR